MRVSTTGVVPPAMARLSSPCALSQAPTSSPAASPGNPAASPGNPAAFPGICRCGAEQPADAAATFPWNTAPPPRPPVPLSGEVDAQEPLADRWSVVHRLLVPDLPRARPFLPTWHEPHTHPAAARSSLCELLQYRLWAHGRRPPLIESALPPRLTAQHEALPSSLLCPAWPRIHNAASAQRGGRPPQPSTAPATPASSPTHREGTRL